MYLKKNKVGLITVANRIIGNLLQAIIRTYQLIIVPLMPAGVCRFHPTCSHYANEAINLHGPIKGSWLALKRISRCNPFGKAGIDEVPPRTKKTLNIKNHITG
jgi:putative membrane protein insertion efficiency factor|tara:strand:- start:80 stop:388 length:309 start_codon:yes stop_codon:yes gene_type:complete